MKTPKDVLKKAQTNDEPVFVLRAQDKLAVFAISKYYQKSVAEGCDKKHILEIEKIYNDFFKWRRNNPDKIKLPD